MASKFWEKKIIYNLKHNVFFFKLSVKDEDKIIYLDIYLLPTKLQRVI